MELRHGRSVLLAACCVTAVQLSAACGVAGGGGGYGSSGELPQVGVSQGGAEPVTLRIADSVSMGFIVTDVSGYTLYRFDQDTAKSPASRCNGQCADKWPPALVTDQVVTQGIERNLVGKVRRENGTWQLTLGGWPLYRFTGDTIPGDINGEGLAGKWYASSPKGAKAGADSGDPAAKADDKKTADKKTADKKTADSGTGGDAGDSAADSAGAGAGADGYSGSSGGGY